MILFSLYSCRIICIFKKLVVTLGFIIYIYYQSLPSNNNLSLHIQFKTLQFPIPPTIFCAIFIQFIQFYIYIFYFALNAFLLLCRGLSFRAIKDIINFKMDFILFSCVPFLDFISFISLLCIVWTYFCLIYVNTVALVYWKFSQYLSEKVFISPSLKRYSLWLQNC